MADGLGDDLRSPDWHAVFGDFVHTGMDPGTLHLTESGNHLIWMAQTTDGAR
jgi:hypothetical protein